MEMDARPELGPPALCLGGFHVWVQGRQYPWEDCYWDGNRLAIMAICTAQGSQVTVQGPCLHVGDLLRWSKECEALLSKARDSITLWAMEPELHLQLSRRGERVRIQVAISPSVASQEHIYRFEVDWQELERFQEGLRQLIATYPQRGEPRPAGEAKSGA